MLFNYNSRHERKILAKSRGVLTNLIISQLLSALDYQTWFKLMLRQYNVEKMIKV